jgi:hypothetical protein
MGFKTFKAFKPFKPLLNAPPRFETVSQWSRSGIGRAGGFRIGLKYHQESRS